MVTIVRDRVAGPDEEGAVPGAGSRGSSNAGLGATLRFDDRPLDDIDVRRGGVSEPGGPAGGAVMRGHLSLVHACCVITLALPSTAWAQFDITGSYNALFHEDQPERIPGPSLGDYTGPAHQRECAGICRGLGRVAADCARASVPRALLTVHSAWPTATCGSGTNAIKRRNRSWPFISTSATSSSGAPCGWTGALTRRQNAEHTWMGFSTGRWDGEVLVVTTTHIKQMWHRRNGVPQSDQVTLTERFALHGQVLTYVTIVEDPVYLTEPLVKTTNMLRNPRPLPPQQLLYPCSGRRRDRRSTSRRCSALSARRESVPR